MNGSLFVVATPIGNLEDITARAARTLREVDLIVCEDTRVTGTLLTHLGIRKPMTSLHVQSDDALIARIMTQIAAGKRVAYTSDAGTPNVNDPGGKLVAAAFAHGFAVVPIPGPSALTVAIAVCGFPMDAFVYEGFVPHKKGRQTLFRRIAERDEPTVLLESTHRIEKTLRELEQNLGDRFVFVGRELTKMHETLYRGTVTMIVSALGRTSMKGEFVIVVAPRRYHP